MAFLAAGEKKKSLNIHALVQEERLEGEAPAAAGYSGSGQGGGLQTLTIEEKGHVWPALVTWLLAPASRQVWPAANCEAGVEREW